MANTGSILLAIDMTYGKEQAGTVKIKSGGWNFS
jgi:hypothetical protein